MLPSAKRIQQAGDALLLVLAVLAAAVIVGGGVAWLTVESNTHSRFVPGSGLTVPAGEVGSAVVGGGE